MAAMGMGFFLSHENIHASPVGEVEWKTEMLSHTYVAQNMWLHALFTPFEDGTVSFSSAYGEFTGSWAMIDEVICVYFDSGPLKGERCNTITPLGDNRFSLTDGVVIERVASGKAF
ncbi:MAG: hypothetical protein AAFO93_05800 [Pseudomonadota bacterium]